MFVNLSARLTVGLCLQTIYSFWKTGINHTGSKFHTCSVHITLKKDKINTEEDNNYMYNETKDRWSTPAHSQVKTPHK